MRKRLCKVNTTWSRELAYAIGLIASDGTLSKDNRHISFTSKDLELIEHFKRCLSLSNKIGKKTRGGEKIKKYYVLQFGDKNFYEFLYSIGLHKNKSKTISTLKIPDLFFIHFFRGCIDGDGSISMFNHPESKHKQLRLRLYSASKPFLVWIKENIQKLYAIQGGWISAMTSQRVCSLSYGKNDSLCLLMLMYREAEQNYLRRKYTPIKELLNRYEKR